MLEMSTKRCTFALNNDIPMQILKKLIRKTMQGITYNVTRYLRHMIVGDVMMLSAKVNETTVRNACSRLKKEGVGEWKCEKRFIEGTVKVQGFKVTRIA